MIVDCHTHIDFSSQGQSLSAHLSAAETVDKCIVLAETSDSCDLANERLSEYVSKHKEKMVGFAVIRPVKANMSTKQLASISDKLGLKGVVLYCCDYGFHPAHSGAVRFYESAQELGLPVFFHNAGPLDAAAVLDFAQPYLLDEVARMFPELKMVIGAMGAPFYEQTLTMVAKHKNVYADLTIRPNSTWQVYNTVVAAYERGVMDKLLFGSGFPSFTAGECIETLLGFNKLLSDTNLPTVPRGSIRSIIERNSLELLGISS
ncbi:MAG: amidohydrolase family protein [Sedimentisphaerales bacterium]|nr:amidohydrolase family protein [Sedimentisphaerales bacterium]